MSRETVRQERGRKMFGTVIQKIDVEDVLSRTSYEFLNEDSTGWWT